MQNLYELASFLNLSKSLFIQDPSMTDWLWELEECKEQKQRSMNFRKDRQKFMDPDEMEKRNIKKLRRVMSLSILIARHTRVYSILSKSSSCLGLQMRV